MLQFAWSLVKKTCTKFVTNCLSAIFYGLSAKHKFCVVRRSKFNISVVILRSNYKISLKRTFLQILICLSAFMNLNWCPLHSANSAWLDSFHKLSLNGCIYTPKLTRVGVCTSIMMLAWCGLEKNLVLAMVYRLAVQPSLFTSTVKMRSVLTQISFQSTGIMGKKFPLQFAGNEEPADYPGSQ